MGEVVCPNTGGFRSAKQPATLASWIERLHLHTASAFIARTVKAIRNRREVWQLTQYDERALHDIGLLPSDVAGALAEPLHNDPSVILAERAQKRVSRTLHRA